MVNIHFIILMWQHEQYLFSHIHPMHIAQRPALTPRPALAEYAASASWKQRVYEAGARPGGSVRGPAVRIWVPSIQRITEALTIEDPEPGMSGEGMEDPAGKG